MRTQAYTTVVEVVAAELMVDVCDVIALVDLSTGSPVWADVLDDGTHELAQQTGQSTFWIGE